MNRFLRCVCGIVAVALVAACEEKQEDNPAPADTRAPADNPAANPAANPAPKKAPTRAQLGQELGSLMESFGKAVKSVKDQATWVPAKAELARIEARTVAITAKLKTLPLPSPAETQVSIQAMKRNEDNLGKALGDKDAFMKRLPQGVARELGQAAGAFSNKMGLAHQALYGNVSP